MATAGLCNTFTIVFRGADLNAGTGQDITATRNLRIVGIQAFRTDAGVGASTCAVSKVDGVTVTAISTTATGAAGVGVVQPQSLAGPMSVIGVADANASVAAGNQIRVLTGLATISTITLFCVGEEQALTVTAA